MLRVGQRPQLIQNLRHNLGFVSDQEVNRRILTQYNLYEYLTPCDPDNKAILQSIIDQWSDYTIKLYETTQYEYDPIRNYDRFEDTDDNGAHAGGSNTTAVDTPNGRKQITSNSGYNTDAMTPTSQVELQGTATQTNDSTYDGTAENHKKSHIYGNIGVMTTQQMIEQERDLIIDPVEFYVNKFADAFNLSMEVDCYGMCCMQ